MNLNNSDKPFSTGKQLAARATMDLTDSEVTQVMEIVGTLVMKYSNRIASTKNLDELRDEAETKMYDIGVLAKIDPTPVLEGKPPVLDILGKVGHPGFSGAYDHEREQWEIRKAKTRGEYYLGEKESVNNTSKRRSDNTKKK